ncbi:putative Cation proton exchanger [Hibiscus syriacus]|uniref:Uncharacterized protein ycf23 n=1 Tax=Hibiscus syriacus TaxID=106335 RepID=A0A6A3BD89_HIBSY|nr:putative Cation proton exchanger [Hibiscus syriacus]
MHTSICMTIPASSNAVLKHCLNPFLGNFLPLNPCKPLRKTASVTTTKALLSSSKETVLKDFHERRALKIISGLQNFDRDNVASVVLPQIRSGLFSSVDPAAFSAAVEAGALMVEIGNYDHFTTPVSFSLRSRYLNITGVQILKLTKETRSILPSVTLSVTVPHTLSLPDQVKLAEILEKEGVDIIQTEGGKCSTPSKSGVLGLIEKATPTLAAAYSISRAVKIPVTCASGLSAVTANGDYSGGSREICWATQGVGSAVNKLNDVIAMVAEVRSIAESLKMEADSKQSPPRERSFNIL